MKRRTGLTVERRTRGGEGKGVHPRRRTLSARAVAREQQLKQLDATIKAEIGGDPAKAARLKAHLAGELPALSTADHTLSLRVPAALLPRIEALVPKVATDLHVTMTRGSASGVTASTVIRLALVEGLQVLERRYSKATR